MLKRLKGKSILFAITFSSSLLISAFTFEMASAKVQHLPRVQKSQTSSVQKKGPYLSDSASIDRVIRSMTLEEKAKFVVGVGMPGITRGPFEITGAVGGTYGIPR